MPEPTTTEWIAVSVAAALVVLLGGLLVIRPALRPGVSIGSRVAGYLIASAAVALLLCAIVLGAAGLQASRLDPALRGDDRPASAFAHFLIDENPDSTERAAGYSIGVLVPLASVLVVLALAAVDPSRPIGLRAIAGAICSALLVMGAFVAIGDTGPLAARAALGLVVLVAGALVALGLDELTHRRTTSPAPASP